MLARSGDATEPCPVPVSLADRIEEAAEVGVQYPVHLRAADPDHEGVQRVMLAALGAEPVREPEEVFLVDRLQHREGRPLDDLVLKGGDRERALPAVRLWYVSPPGRLCPIRSSVDPVMQIG